LHTFLAGKQHFEKSSGNHGGSFMTASDYQEPVYPLLTSIKDEAKNTHGEAEDTSRLVGSPMYLHLFLQNQ
jgi:hypothetical protein